MRGYIPMHLDTVALEFLEGVKRPEIRWDTVEATAMNDSDASRFSCFVVLLDTLGYEGGLTGDVTVRGFRSDARLEEFLAVEGIGANSRDKDFGAFAHILPGTQHRPRRR